MSEQPVPDVAVVEGQQSAAVTLLGVGVVVTGVHLTLEARPVVSLLALAAAVAVGLLLVAPLARWSVRMWRLDEVPVVAPQEPRRGRGEARWAGVRTGLVSGAAGTAVLVLAAAVLDDREVLGVAGPVLVGVAGVTWGGAHGLRRWERSRGRVVHRRVGARRLTWSNAQARAQLVAVEDRRDP